MKSCRCAVSSSSVKDTICEAIYESGLLVALDLMVGVLPASLLALMWSDLEYRTQEVNPALADVESVRQGDHSGMLIGPLCFG